MCNDSGQAVCLWPLPRKPSLGLYSCMCYLSVCPAPPESADIPSLWCFAFSVIALFPSLQLTLASDSVWLKNSLQFLACIVVLQSFMPFTRGTSFDLTSDTGCKFTGCALSYDMVWYLFTAIGFPPGSSGQKSCKKNGKRQLYAKGETLHKQYKSTEDTKWKTKKQEKHKRKLNNISQAIAGPSGHAVWGIGLRPLACWGRGFESHRGAWMFVCCKWCVLSGRGLWDVLITLPEESYQLWCIIVCDVEASKMRRPWPTLGHIATGGNLN